MKRNPNWSHGAAVGVASTALSYREQTAIIGKDYTYTLQAYYKNQSAGDPVSTSTSSTHSVTYIDPAHWRLSFSVE